MWLEYLEAMGLTGKIILYTQKPNSPDHNLCDLGVLNSIQADYNRASPRNFDDIIRCTTDSYWRLSRTTLNRLWLTHMSVMNGTLEVNGDNTYKIPHMNKAKME